MKTELLRFMKLLHDSDRYATYVPATDQPGFLQFVEALERKRQRTGTIQLIAGAADSGAYSGGAGCAWLNAHASAYQLHPIPAFRSSGMAWSAWVVVWLCAIFSLPVQQALVSSLSRFATVLEKVPAASNAGHLTIV